MILSWCNEELKPLNIPKQPPEVFCSKRFSQKFRKIHRTKACNFVTKEILTHVFCCEFCKISRNTFFTEHIWMIASESTGGGGIRNENLKLFCLTLEVFLDLSNSYAKCKQSLLVFSVLLWKMFGWTRQMCPYFSYLCTGS